ncbi:MAG: hypothetical protein H7A19_05455 [Rhodanobacteraceae bacterium]|nr:hypothetical protein [Rhodanobacteraceae bacterium]
MKRRVQLGDPGGYPDAVLGSPTGSWRNQATQVSEDGRSGDRGQADPRFTGEVYWLINGYSRSAP